MQHVWVKFLRNAFRNRDESSRFLLESVTVFTSVSLMRRTMPHCRDRIQLGLTSDRGECFHVVNYKVMIRF